VVSWCCAFPNHLAVASIDYPSLTRIVILVNPITSVPKKAYHDFYSFGIAYLETPFVSCDLNPKASAFLSSLPLFHLSKVLFLN